MSLDVWQFTLYVALLHSLLTFTDAQQSIPLGEEGDHVCTVMESFTAQQIVSSTVEYEISYYTRCGLFSTCSRLRTAYRVAYIYRFVTQYREVPVCCSGYVQTEDTCTPCASDQWGDNCENDCQCENGGSCDVQTGTCGCPSGFTGDRCESLCPEGFYGQNCSTVCDCPSYCQPENGTCICEPGFTGQSCSDPCPEGTFGQDCQGVCLGCSSGEHCDPVTGLCAVSCNCTNGGSCDQQGGCICPDGFEGIYCEIEGGIHFEAQDKDKSILVDKVSASSSHLLARLSLLPKNDDRQSYIVMHQMPSAHRLRKRQTDADSDVDTQPPVVTSCPEDIVVTVEEGRQSAVVSWTPPVATDSSGDVFQSHQFSPNASFPLGDTEVEYIFVDQSGNEASCRFTVSVIEVDTTDPVIINCTSTIHRTVELGTLDLEVNWVEPTAFDAFDPELDVEKSHSPPTNFTVGTHTVTYRFSDDVGNEAVCSFSIIISAEDTLPPVVENCPSNISDTTELGTSSKAISWTSPTVVDASETIVIDQSHFQGETFPLGTTRVTITYIDGSGNSAVCQFYVTLTTVDSVSPVVNNCPTLIVEQVELGEGGTVVSWDPVTVTDFSSTSTLFQSDQPGDFFSVGISDVIILFQDASGNHAGCYFTVEIIEVDTTPPVISGCPNTGINKTVELMVTSAVVSWAEPTALDLSGEVIRNRTATPGSSFSLGITTVTYTFSDGVGNSATCTFQVSVVQVDTQPPEIIGCPDDIVEVVETGTTGKEITWTEPTATDLSGVQLVSQTHVPPATFPLGPTIVTYTFRDSAGISNQCSFDVTIVAVDTMKPEISNCPEDIYREIEAGLGTAAIIWTEPTATDNSGNVPFLVERTFAPGDNFPPGNTTVVYKFLDYSGNVAVCSFSVIITEVDTTPPQIIFCPQNVHAPPVELGSGGTEVSWPNEPFAYDLSGDPVELVFQTHQSNDFFYPGGTAVMYRFRDTSGNEATCSFLVIVGEVDTTPPEVNDCPLPIMEMVELGSVSLPVNWTVPYATDISNNVTLVSQTHAPGELFFIGKTDVTYLFRDISGNEADCTFQVIVTTMDTTPPIISNCPADITLTIPHMSTSTEVTWTEPTAIDLSGVAVLFNKSAEPGSVFNVGISMVSYIFTDQSSNRAYCDFLVTVQTEAPDEIVISNCPGNIEVTAEPNEDVRVVWSEPTASKKGGTANLQEQSHTSPAVLSPGVTTIVYTFRDDEGNTAMCNFTVTVVEVDALQCLDINITAEAPPQKGFVHVNWTTAALTNYTQGLFVTVTNYSSGDVFPIGSTTIDYILFDADSRSENCFFTVIVSDVTQPVISDCPNDVSLGLPDGIASLAVTWEEPTALDNSGNVTKRRSHKPGDNFKIGSERVLYEFYDPSGNTATCSFDIILTGMGGGNSSPENGFFQNDFVVTILASAGIILLAVIVVAVCLASMCCCRGQSNDIPPLEDDIDIDDNYFNDANHADDNGYRYVNNGYTRTDMYAESKYAESKYDEPPTMSQTLQYSKKKANGHGLPPGGHYSQTLPSRPIHDPLDEGTRTIKHSYNGPIPGQNGNGVKSKNNYPPLEVELQETTPSHTGQGQTFLPIPEEIDFGDYLEIKGTAL